MPILSPLNIKDAVVSIDINNLVKAGLSIDEWHSINKDLHYNHPVNEEEIFWLHVRRSSGYEGNLEFNYGFFIETSESNENTHISLEVAVCWNYPHRDYEFNCPILGSDEICKKLYLRNDFPIFGSQKALNLI